MSEQNIHDRTLNFQQLIDTFTNRIEALRLSFGVIIETIQLSKNESDKTLVNFSEPFLKHEENETEVTISIKRPFDKFSEFKKLEKKVFIIAYLHPS